MADEELIITEAAREKLRTGELIETREVFVHDKLLKEYQLALRDPNPLYWDDEFANEEGYWKDRVCPTGFAVALNPMERSPSVMPASAFWAELLDLPEGTQVWGGFAAYNEIDMEEPIRLGDKLRLEIRNRRCYEKRGKRAVLVCAETEYRIIRQDETCLGVGLYGNMREFEYPEAKEEER